MSNSSFLKKENPRWAYEQKLDEDDFEEEKETVLAFNSISRSTGKYKAADYTLSKQNLPIKSLKNLTIGHNLNGCVNCIKFHPEKAIVFVGTNNGTVSLFEIIENTNVLSLKKNNNFLQEIKFKNSKIASLNFFNNGMSLFVAPSNKKYSFCYDLIKDKILQLSLPESLFYSHLLIGKRILSTDGTFIAYLVGNTDVYVFVFNTMEHLHTFRATSSIIDFCFATNNRNVIYAFSQIGIVYYWDLTQKNDSLKFLDYGCVEASCLALSLNEQFVACGSNTGIVNIYETTNLWNIKSDVPAKPLYVLKNLTTSISFLRFNHNAQLLSFGSDIKSLSMRLMYCKTGTVYQNFPFRSEKFLKNYVKCCEFSPNSAFLAYGTKSGECKFYQLQNFDKY